MNPLIQLKKAVPVFLVALVCFGLLPTMQAVSPPPDGGYPGGNTAEGQAALLSLTSGGYNTAVGYFSLRRNTTGAFNTALGAWALFANTADQNTATGAGALLSNTTGSGNTANGAIALFFNTEGTNNTAIGIGALSNNLTGSANTANGINALSTNTAGDANTAIGGRALLFNTTGDGNTAIGAGALINNDAGIRNIAVGFNAGGDIATASDTICIGTTGQNVSNRCFIGQIFGVTSSGGTPVFINSNGQLGTGASSERYKEQIKPIDQASEALYALKPISFRYKREIDPAGVQQFGLVAEDVEKVNPDLVVRDKGGKPYSVRYDQVNAMLLNEFLKEHRKVAKLEAIVAQQHKDFEAAVAELKGQIQKVSAQLEVSKPAPQTVLND